MNFLVINHYAGSPRHGMEYRPYYLGREWVRLGQQVTVVGASFSHLRTRAPEVRGLAAQEALDGITYIWLRTPGYRGNGARRALNIFAFVGQLLRLEGWLAGIRPDVVVASSTYPLDVLPAWRIARRAGARLAYEVHDLWPLSPVELGGMSPWHPFIVLMQWAENFAYRRADRVVSILPAAEPHMRAHGLAAGRFTHVPNGVDVAGWGADRGPLPEEHRIRFAALRKEGRFLVGYTGAHGVANALDVVIDAAVRLNGHPAAFALVGQGPEKARLEVRAACLGLDNVVFLPPVSKENLPALLEAVDALFIGWQRKPLYRFGVSPNKLLDYMMAGRPVIHAVGAANDLVAESGCGLSVPPEDPGALAEAVGRLAKLSEEERVAMGRRGRDYVVRHHDYRVLAGRFLDEIAPG